MAVRLGVAASSKTLSRLRALDRQLLTNNMAPTGPLPYRSLLLLPPVPSQPTYAALKAEYGSCLSAVLQTLASSPRAPHEPAVLDIAVPCPHLFGRLQLPRGPLYANTQTLVANLYKLICVVAAKDAIATEGAEGVDARLVLVAYPRDGNLVQTPKDAIADHEALGPAIDLASLATSPRPWGTVFSVDSEEGERVLANFQSLDSSKRSVSKIRSGTGLEKLTSSGSAPPPREVATLPTNHSSVAVGGTFDHLHIGHKLLLTMFAFVLARQPPTAEGKVPTSLTVGITGDELLKNKKFPEVLESWDRRQEAVHDFLSSLIHFGNPDDSHILVEKKSEPGPNGHAVHVTYPSKLTIKYVQIMDPFGPTITDQSISALVISKETRSGGNAVNLKREEKGWAPLEVFEVDVLDAGEEEEVDETFQNKLSSTEIRRILSERAAPTAHA